MEKTALLCETYGGSALVLYFVEGQLISNNYYSSLEMARAFLENDGYFPFDDLDNGVMLYKRQSVH